MGSSSAGRSRPGTRHSAALRPSAAERTFRTSGGGGFQTLYQARSPKMKIVGWLLLIAASIVAAGAGLLAYRGRPAVLVSQALGTKALPRSIHDMDCKGWGMTDVLYTCTLSVDPKDFPTLLSARRWSQARVLGGSYSFSSGPKVGSNFSVDIRLETTPSNFPHGGSIWLVASPDRSRAQVDYYEE